VRRVIFAVVAGLILAVTAGAIYYKHETRTREKRGSATVEFVTTAPVEKKRPVRSIATVPWPTYGYDPARTRATSQLHIRPPFKQLWTFRTRSVLEFPPVVGYGRLFVTQFKGRLWAIDAAKGKPRWHKDFGHCAAASPTIGKNVIYVAYMQPLPCNRYPRTQRGFVVALLVRDKQGRNIRGRVLWRFRSGPVESSPLLVRNVLYFGSWDHHVYALDVRNRKRPRLLWKFKADDEVNSSPAYSNGLVYFGTNSGSVYAVTSWTGKLQWKAQSFARFGDREYFYATPTVAYGRVYIGNTDGTLFAFGARTGHLLWARRAGTYIYTSAAVWRKKVYVGTWDGKVSAFSAATGDTVWSINAVGAVHGAPTILNGILYYSTCPLCGKGGTRYTKRGPPGTFGVDARNGRLLWRHWAGRYSPVVAGPDRLYLTGYTRIYGFEHRRKHAKKKQPQQKQPKRP
jgi:outer membrane protein assembly factor BamB